MTDINKQKFLTELGKLLTFMYEEDRLKALALYSKMFDETEDEQSLLTFLVSPTRQAVVVARAYNAKERKLQVHAQSRDEDGLELSTEETPDYVLAIEQIHRSAIERQLIAPAAPPVPANQLSLFEDAPAPAEAEPLDAPAEAASAPEEAALPVEAAVQPDEEADSAPPQEEAPSEAGEETPEPEAPVDEVDSFLADFSIPQEELEPAEEAQEEQEEGIELMPDEDEEMDVFEDEPVSGPVRKPKIFLLILYIILAVPITLLAILLLLIPTLLALALAVGFIVTGAAALIAAFSGFAVFADILVVLGAALAALALGLLFLWLFIWFIGGAIAGLVRGVISLGGAWCYKEVPAE